MSCAWHEVGSVELYFYDELDAGARLRFESHLGDCRACRDALADLEVIRRALAVRRLSATPPPGSWEPFMRRLDVRLNEVRAARSSYRWAAGSMTRIAAMLAVAAAGLYAGFEWQRSRIERAAPAVSETPVAREAPPTQPPSLVAAADRHLERSKLVLLGLAAKDPRRTRAGDWSYERQLASTLIADTTQYRLAAADQGRADLADVLGDLETVLLQASLGDDEDPRALERLQRLIDRRDLLTKIGVMNTEGPARRVSVGGAGLRGYDGRGPRP